MADKTPEPGAPAPDPGQAARILPAYATVGDAEMSEAVHQALGFASVCWEPMDCTGVFEGDRVAQAAGELLGIIGQYADARGRSAPCSGRAAYEVWRAAVPDYVCNVPAGPWEELPETIQAGFNAVAVQEPQPAPGAPALREAVIAEVREAASCGSDDGDECPKCTRHAAAILAAFAAQEPKPAPGMDDDDFFDSVTAAIPQPAPVSASQVRRHAATAVPELAAVRQVLAEMLDAVRGWDEIRTGRFAELVVIASRAAAKS